MTELDKATEELNSAIMAFEALLIERGVTTRASIDCGSFRLSWNKHRGRYSLLAGESALSTASGSDIPLLDCSRQRRVEGSKLLESLFQEILSSEKKELDEVEDAFISVKKLIKQAKKELAEPEEANAIGLNEGKTFQKPPTEGHAAGVAARERSRKGNEG